MPWDLTHNRKHPLVQLRFPGLVAGNVGVNTDHVDHVPPQDG